MQLLQMAHHVADPAAIDPKELVRDQLLSQYRGEILLIRSDQTTICNRSAGNLRQRALSWLNMVAKAKSARYISGCVSDKGGRFRIATRNEALALIARLIYEELQQGLE